MTPVTKLRDLKPAETYLFLNPKEFEHNECIKLVVMDLILKQVLKYEKRSQRMNPRAKSFSINLLSRGINYHSYKFNAYEKRFLNPFKKKDKKIKVRSYGKKYLDKEFNGIENIAKHIVKSLGINQYIRTSFLYFYTRNLKLKSGGNAFVRKIEKQIEAISLELNDLNQSDTRKSKELLDQLGNNFLIYETLEDMEYVNYAKLFEGSKELSDPLNLINADILSHIVDIYSDFSNVSFGYSNNPGSIYYNGYDDFSF